jgi:hypothetical protein
MILTDAVFTKFLISPTSGGRSVGIVRWRTQATEFSFFIDLKEVIMNKVFSVSKVICSFADHDDPMVHDMSSAQNWGLTN